MTIMCRHHQAGVKQGGTGYGRQPFVHALAIGCLLAIILTFAGCTTPVAHSANERFTLAWLDQNQMVRVRFSTDGRTWQDATFPQLSVNRGVGAAADPNGVLFLVAGAGFSAGDVGPAVWGVGPNNYSASVDHLPPLPTGNRMDSAPSLAYAGNSVWLFAFLDHSSAKVWAFNSGPRTWADVTPAIGVNNTSVSGRPSIVVKGNTAVLTWLRNPGATSELQVVLGTLDGNGNVNWQGGSPFPNTENGFGSVAQHALTQDQTSFLLGVVRPDNNPSGQIQTFTLFVYESTDGQHWNKRTQLGAANPPNASLRDFPLTIAAHSDGTIVVAENIANHRFFRFDGQAWSVITSGVFTGTPQDGKDLALVATGRP
jgi:hypothetical protein